MTDFYHYANEQLSRALSTLVGPQPQRERVALALQYHISALKPEAVPPALRDKLKSLYDSLTRLEGGSAGQGAIAATVDAISDEEVDQAAQRILELYQSYRDYLESLARSRAP